MKNKDKNKFETGQRVKIIFPECHPCFDKTGKIKSIESEAKNPNRVLPYVVEFPDDKKTYWFDEDEIKGI